MSHTMTHSFSSEIFRVRILRSRDSLISCHPATNNQSFSVFGRGRGRKLKLKKSDGQNETKNCTQLSTLKTQNSRKNTKTFLVEKAPKMGEKFS